MMGPSASYIVIQTVHLLAVMQVSQLLCTELAKEDVEWDDFLLIIYPAGDMVLLSRAADFEIRDVTSLLTDANI